jgi:vacuolar-type H+-ATPase subunit I/STV1
MKYEQFLSEKQTEFDKIIHMKNESCMQISNSLKSISNECEDEISRFKQILNEKDKIISDQENELNQIDNELRKYTRMIQEYEENMNRMILKQSEIEAKYLSLFNENRILRNEVDELNRIKFNCAELVDQINFE